MSAPGRISRLAWPPIASAEAAPLAALVAAQERSQWLAPHEITHHQRRQLAALIAHHAANSPFTARRLADAGLSAAEAMTADGFARLAPLTRRALQDAADLDSPPPDAHGAVSEVESSGSTGQPVRVRRTALNRLDWQAFALRDHGWHKRELGGRLCVIRSGLDAPVARPDWGAPSNLLHATGPAIALPVRMSIADQARQIAAFAPTTLILFPSNLDGLIAEYARSGAVPRIPDIRTYGEMLSDATRDAARTAFGATISDVYSSEELGHIALQCPESGLYHVMAEGLLIEILDEDGAPCPPGATGRVVATDLRNFATPLIRYDTGDLAQAGAPCGCGRGLPVIERILGRRRNLVSYPDGSRRLPFLTIGGWRAMGVRERQFVQRDAGTIELRLVIDTGFDRAAEARVAAAVRAALGHDFALDFRYFEGGLPRGPAGKFEEFIGLPAD